MTINSNLLAYNRFAVKYMGDSAFYPWGTGDVSVYPLNSSSKGYSVRFTAPVSKTISTVHLMARVTGSPGTYTISVKDDDGVGQPTAGAVSESVTTSISDGWNTFTLDSAKSLTADSIYHITVEPATGTFNSSNYAECVTTCSRERIPFHTSCDPSETKKAYYDLYFSAMYDDGGGDGYLMCRGSLALNEYHPIFAVMFTDNTSIGQPYDVVDTYGINGNNYYGFSFTPDENMTINYVVFWVCNEGDATPADNLYLTIYYDDTGTPTQILDSKQFTIPGYFIYRCHWYGVMLDAPQALTSGTKYYFLMKSPSSTLGKGYITQAYKTSLRKSGFSTPGYFHGQSAAVFSTDALSTITEFGTNSAMPFMLGYLTGNDATLPMAIWDEMNTFAKTAAASSTVELCPTGGMTNRNIHTQGNIYLRIIDLYDLSTLVSEITYTNINTNMESAESSSFTMPNYDVQARIDLYHKDGGTPVYDDDMLIEVRLA